MTRSAPETIRGRRAADTRAAVMSAAKALFDCYGYTATDMRTVASAAGYSTGAVFGHFSGKDELFAACFPESHVQLRTAEAICLAVGGDWNAPREPWLDAADRALGGLVAYQRAAA